MLDDGIAMGNRLTQPPLYGKRVGSSGFQFALLLLLTNSV